MKRIALILAFAFALPVFAAPNPGQPAPDFTLSDLSGKSVKLSDLRGKTVVLEWVTRSKAVRLSIMPSGCKPCSAARPMPIATWCC